LLYCATFVPAQNMRTRLHRLAKTLERTLRRRRAADRCVDSLARSVVFAGVPMLLLGDAAERPSVDRGPWWTRLTDYSGQKKRLTSKNTLVPTLDVSTTSDHLRVHARYNFAKRV
jgi:hypothetical protein